ncbi:uncharacterized protein LAESUDRAFT_727647 [Laetiporus sulphureus 93-53]|uniref:Aminoglycoside phosphotransferase domain-containing protein n=1 Tax=Laetiporus sulphureus 93-53 TaxID=1314785 RepID=A0A165DFM0_9APHY|nr:uncharacterized protein LAESUDRAFT_727647 [Laetiporus sulphureus 93-53]KZT04790.1 hypothetical protein LAESUDRAFT_727647 [Laetiporus sulphureus 93-53]
MTSAAAPSAAELEDQYRSWLQATLSPDGRAFMEKRRAFVNVNKLKEAASEALRDTCTGVYFVGQGGFNLIYILTFEHVPHVVARVNGAYHEQDKEQTDELVAHRISSEAATLGYVRRHTTIPVAKVFAVQTDPRNPVNARYTLQERIFGRSLLDIWHTLTAPQRTAVISQIAQIESKLHQTRFPAIGSLRKQADGEISVGPLGLSCTHAYHLRRDRGPWTSSMDWLRAYTVAELDLLESAPDEWAALRRRARLHNGDAETGAEPCTHLAYFRTYFRLLLDALDTLAAVLPKEEYDPPQMPFVLFHEDLSMSNIMVAYDDPARVVGVVDWEGACVVPLWACFGEDHLLDADDDDDAVVSLRLARDRIHEEMEPKVTKAKAPRFPLHHLYFVVSSWGSMAWSIETSWDCVRTMLAQCPEKYALPFGKLLQFIDSCQIHALG